MRRRPLRIAFLQLPRPDQDAGGTAENVPQAALYLAHALTRGRGYPGGVEPLLVSPQTDGLDDAGVLKAIEGLRPDVVAATLYLWNSQRTISLLRRLRRALPDLRMLAGGPEVTRDNGWLLSAGVFDALAEGEGEAVFSGLLRAPADFRPLAACTARRSAPGRYTWGTVEVARPPLVLPPPDDPLWRPDARGMAYLESSRGCPLRCSFCRYPQARRGVGVLPLADVVRRVRVLRERGAREIRFIDPTFNSRPDFEEMIAALAALNRGRALTFFAELRAERLTARQAGLLASAGFREIEVGLQSLSPEVLRAVHRPTDLPRLERGLRALSGAGIIPTVDVMSGLPFQTLEDVRHSLEWASRTRRARVQLLPALALPGTELRSAWKGALRWQARPPYRITRTRWMDEEDLAAAERIAADLGGEPDAPTRRFVGVRLPDLFADRVRLRAEDAAGRVLPAGRFRRAVEIAGPRLFERRDGLARAIIRAVRAEPHGLWQFVLCPEYEEPLDLLDALAAVIRGLPPHVLDRLIATGSPPRLAARRLFVRLSPSRRWDPRWVRAAETLLGENFH
jgi:radical SAM superfamily enzyme YgiQ (UPF0313 family)